MKVTNMVIAVLAIVMVGCATVKEDQARISRSHAQQIALAKVPGGTVKEAELEREKGRLIWSFDVATPGNPNVTEVGVDAITGEVVGVETETPEQQAREKDSAAATPKFSHPRDINHPWLPLGSLRQDILQSKSERVERTARPEVKKTFEVFGQPVDALAVEDKEFVDGKLAEITLDYYAQDDDGTVYYLGEDVDEYKNGQVSSHSGAWLLGRDTHTPGVLLPAHPHVGDKFMSENVPHVTWEEDRVVSVTETVTVPAGTFANCIKIKERTSDGATEYKLYAPGVGCIKEMESDGELALQSYNRK